MSNKNKYCVDCVHHLIVDDRHMCDVMGENAIDLVTGEVELKDCSLMRYTKGLFCGENGDYYERRKEAAASVPERLTCDYDYMKNIPWIQDAASEPERLTNETQNKKHWRIYEKDGCVWAQRDGWTVCAKRNYPNKNPLSNDSNVVAIRDNHGSKVVLAFDDLQSLLRQLGLPPIKARHQRCYGNWWNYYKQLLELKAEQDASDLSGGNHE